MREDEEAAEAGRDEEDSEPLPSRAVVPGEKDQGGGGDDGDREPGPAASPVVVPPEEDAFEGARRRRRRLLIGVLVAAVAVAVLVMVGPGLFRGGLGDDAFPAAGESAGSAGTPSPGAGAVRFTAWADSLEEELASFGERRRDFELNRIGCEGLGRGLERVDSAFDRLTGTLGSAGTDLEGAERDRYRRLSERVRDAERTLEEAGCTASP